jgi:hypothetical protein
MLRDAFLGSPVVTSLALRAGLGYNACIVSISPAFLFAKEPGFFPRQAETVENYSTTIFGCFGNNFEIFTPRARRPFVTSLNRAIVFPLTIFLGSPCAKSDSRIGKGCPQKRIKVVRFASSSPKNCRPVNLKVTPPRWMLTDLHISGQIIGGCSCEREAAGSDGAEATLTVMRLTDSRICEGISEDAGFWGFTLPPPVLLCGQDALRIGPAWLLEPDDPYSVLSG